MPVSVPVNAGPYGDGSILHASPQMGAHPSVSPRPSSSSGMLDVTGNNGYPPGKTAPRPSYPVGFSQPISTNWPPAIGSVAEPFPPHGPDSMARRLSFSPLLGTETHSVAEPDESRSVGFSNQMDHSLCSHP